MDKLHYPLNGLEISMLNPDAKFVKYTDLYHYSTIHEVFGDYKKVIILYLIQNSNSGHYTCLFKNKNGINFFDPYGVPPDYELEILTPIRRRQLNQEHDYLQHLLKNKRVIFNNITYQKQGTATCGCFVSHRLHYSHLDDLEYVDLFFRSVAEPDVFVSDWCFSKLNAIYKKNFL